MGLPVANFPASPWTGLSAGRPNFNNRVGPTPEEYLQVVAEIKAVEEAFADPTVDTIPITNGVDVHNLTLVQFGKLCLLQGELVDLEVQIDQGDAIVIFSVAPETTKTFFAMLDVSSTLSVIKLTLNSDGELIAHNADLAVGNSLYLGNIWFLKE